MNAVQRIYRLGKDQIKEQIRYEHLGLLNFVNESGNDRILEKIRKGRKALNAAASIGLKPGGLTIHACSILFWAMVLPIITFSCELWVINDNDVKLLEELQRYAGRRIQRFPYRSPNETSYVGLGWLRLEIFIYVKKVLFVRGISILLDDSIYKQIFILRLSQYEADKESANENRCLSPIFDIIRVVDLFGLYKEMKEMLHGVRFYSINQWKVIVWKRAWEIERQDWVIRSSLFTNTKTLNTVSDNGRLLIWWQLADIAPDIMRPCEVMAKVVCKASSLKVDCYQFRKDPVRRTYCELWNNFSIEDTRHLFLHCPALSALRNDLFNNIEIIEKETSTAIIQTHGNIFATLMGRITLDIDVEVQIKFLKVVAKCFYKMYSHVIKERNGIG